MAPTTDLTKTLLSVLFMGLLAAISLWVLLPFLPAMIWAAMIVIATWSTLLKLQHRFNNKRFPAVLTMALLMTALVIIPLTAALFSLISNRHVIVSGLQDLANTQLPPAPAWLEDAPLLGPRIAARWNELAATAPQDLIERAKPYIHQAFEWIVASVGSITMLVVHCILTIIIASIFYSNGEKIAQACRTLTRRLAGTRGEEALQLAAQSVRAVAMGIVGTALIQTALGGLGAGLAGVPHAGLLTAVILIFCVVQLGPLLPLLGAVAWLYTQEQNTAGTILLGWAVAVGLMDGFVRPLLIKRGADLPAVLITVGVLGGMISFGIVGLFIGPVVLAVTLRLLSAWMTDNSEPTVFKRAIEKAPAPTLPPEINH
ncbi:Putative transport protein YdiK [Bdellovibrio bacteriovorus]|uniref:AI-2E family transporter YdiK n=1 Tax=Bdellovibrio bacteriovorus TaxID=959 RepID=UPI00045C0FAB|nr:AI-2E family transporter YdiK [Bdellovibrio bacteriovorus]AHZ84190.1 permease [Bdellovibrio bacteriovorus]BEV68075.1 Putative transport protein YdiK [Bdellovibrio bacteriovorus]